jgi:hypothetical protein
MKKSSRLLLPALLAMMALAAVLVLTRSKPPKKAAVAVAPPREIAFFAKPVAYTFFLPEGGEFTGRKVPVCIVTYGFKVDNCVEIKHGSLNLTAITDEDGNDLLEFARGRDGYIARVPNVSIGNSGIATFNIEVVTEKPMTLPKVTGTVNIRTAGNTETETLIFNTGDTGVEQTAGPLAFAINNEDFRFREFRINEFSMEMKGDEKLAKEVVLNANGKQIPNRGTSHINEKRLYHFANTPATPEFTLTGTYYTDLQEVSVAFGE